MSTPTLSNAAAAPSPLTISSLVVALVFFTLGLFSLFLYKCRNQNDPSVDPTDPSGVKPRTGLDPSLILSFPTFIYSNVKHLRQEDFDLECAICLSEFEDSSVLRLLTVCHHVFHQECIDLWLESHTSCPACRANLDIPQEKLLEKIPNMLRGSDEGAESIFEDAVSIQIEIDQEESKGDPPMVTPDNVGPVVDRHHRWNSTGHSITKRRPECKHTLRLPENVIVKVTKGRGGRSMTFGGVSDRNQVGLSEIIGSSS